jgi:hypothetical protein
MSDTYRAALQMAADTFELIAGDEPPRVYRVGEATKKELQAAAQRGLARNAARAIRRLLDDAAHAGDKLRPTLGEEAAAKTAVAPAGVRGSFLRVVLPEGAA